MTRGLPLLFTALLLSLPSRWRRLKLTSISMYLSVVSG
jgi:hypothetical protein